MKKSVLILSLVIVFCAVSVAQDKAQVYGGYQYTRLDATSDNGVNAQGWNADLAVRVANHVSFVADFSGAYYKEDATLSGFTAEAKTKVHNYLFGPRFSASAGKVTPFAEALFGLARTTIEGSVDDLSVSSTSNGFGMAFGGGVDVNVSDHFAVRVAKVDYMVNKVSFNTLGISYDDTLNNFRYSAGVVLRF